MTKSTTAKSTEFVNPFESFFRSGQEAMQSFFKEGMAGYENAMSSVAGQGGDFNGYYGDAAEAGKANLEAMLAAGAVCGKGWSELNAQWLGFSKQLLEDNLAGFKAAFGAKSVHEALDLQGRLAKDNLEKVLAQNAKLGELATKVATESVEPINARVAAGMEKWNQAAA